MRGSAGGLGLLLKEPEEGPKPEESAPEANAGLALAVRAAAEGLGLLLGETEEGPKLEGFARLPTQGPPVGLWCVNMPSLSEAVLSAASPHRDRRCIPQGRDRMACLPSSRAPGGDEV